MGSAPRKDNWTQIARYLTKQYHVICPDLPGFGESTRLPEASYDIPSQVERINRFAEVLKLGKFHLAGNSMGGWITGIYGAKYPSRVLSLGLFAPGGIRSPEKSDLMKMLEAGGNPLLISNVDDFDQMIRLVFEKVPMMPYPIKKEAAKRAIKNMSFNKKIFDDLRKKYAPLEFYLPRDTGADIDTLGR